MVIGLAAMVMGATATSTLPEEQAWLDKMASKRKEYIDLRTQAAELMQRVSAFHVGQVR